MSYESYDMVYIVLAIQFDAFRPAGERSKSIRRYLKFESQERPSVNKNHLITFPVIIMGFNHFQYLTYFF